MCGVGRDKKKEGVIFSAKNKTAFVPYIEDYLRTASGFIFLVSNILMVLSQCPVAAMRPSLRYFTHDVPTIQ